MAVSKKSALAFVVSTILLMLIAFPVLAQQWSIETVDNSSLSRNNYNAGLIIHNNAPGDNPTVLPVTLQVIDKPDLVITEKYEVWVNLVVKSYNVTYTVKNQGNAASVACQTRVYIDAGQYNEYYVCPELAAGASYTNTVGPFTMLGDSDDILVYADPGTVVGESNEDNNWMRNVFTTRYDIDLAAGWNLVSLPLIPDNTDINSVISAGNLASGNAANIALAYHYDTTAGIWMWWNGTLAGNLHTMEDGFGYWLYATVADTLTVHGTQAGHPGPDYPVLAGWEMIGFTSTSNMAPETYLASEDGNYSLLYRWAGGGWWWWMKNTPASTFTVMEPGYGYWLFMNADGTITPP